MFERYFASQGLETDPTPFDGRSDYGPFLDVGVPAGGLFSGAENVKTPEQAAVYGGTAGEPFDACYHQACDDISNLSSKALFELGDAVAHAVADPREDQDGLLRGRQQAREVPRALDEAQRLAREEVGASPHPQDLDGPPPGGPSHYCPAR